MASPCSELYIHSATIGYVVISGLIYASGITSSTNLQQKHSQVQRGYGGGPYDAMIIGLDVAADRSCR